MELQSKYRTLRDVPQLDYLSPGGSLCAGCGGLLAVRLFHKVLGKNVVWVNAAGCMTIMVNYPLVPLKSNWLYTAFASAPAGAQGIRDALDILIKKGKIPESEDLKVVVVTGDGAAYDIGLQSTSGAIYRNLDFYYLCYDNQAYGNTGFQVSSATPVGSSTATTPATPSQPAGNIQKRKDLFEIWRAHNPPYIATLSSSYAVDFLKKVEKGSGFRGPKLYISLAGCPTGWGYDPRETIREEKLAVDTGIWPLKEAVEGKVRHTVVPRALRPVEEYLATQARYQHLFTPTKRIDVIRQIQNDVNSYWEGVADREGFDIKLVET
ncbi:MAG: thiamine pyrophosphate-dependent enzyme [Conexivisphaerales archaeon]